MLEAVFTAEFIHKRDNFYEKLTQPLNASELQLPLKKMCARALVETGFIADKHSPKVRWLDAVHTAPESRICLRACSFLLRPGTAKILNCSGCYPWDGLACSKFGSAMGIQIRKKKDPSGIPSSLPNLLPNFTTWLCLQTKTVCWMS